MRGKNFQKEMLCLVEDMTLQRCHSIQLFKVKSTLFMDITI